MQATPDWTMSIVVLLGLGGVLAIAAIIAVVVIAALSRRQ